METGPAQLGHAASDLRGFFLEVMELALRHGPKAFDVMQKLHGSERQMIDRLVDAGLLEQTPGGFHLTGRGVEVIERHALDELLDGLAPGTSSLPRAAGESADDHRLMAGLGAIVARTAASCPVHLDPADIQQFLADCHTPVAAAMLLDMSGSMAQFDRFLHAKKLALAMHALVRLRFPEDTFDVIGFHSLAEHVPEDQLPLLLPRPTTVFDYTYSRRVPLAQADQAPQHFTNLQMGLRLAREVLCDRPAQTRLVFVVTDGEPTAHVDNGELVLLYPPDREALARTFSEAAALTRIGASLAVFALIDDYHDMDWVSYVDQLTRQTRGVSYYCGSGDLAGCVMESYISGKRRKSRAG